MVVHGNDGLDEISMSAPTTLCEVKNGWLRSYEITPEQFGFRRSEKTELAGGTPADNAAILRSVLGGENGAKRDSAVLNAAAAMYISGRCDSIEDAARVAGEIIDSGKALDKLEEFIRRSNEGQGDRGWIF